jgi:hypothetical protein
MARTVVQIRLKPEEKERLRQEAERSGMDISKLVRHRVLGGPDSSSTGVERAAAVDVGASVGSVPPPAEFRCPQGSCDFRCGSANGRCPVHGRRVVGDG